MLVPLLAVGSLIGISWAFPAALYVLLPLLIVAATAYIYLAYIKVRAQFLSALPALLASLWFLVFWCVLCVSRARSGLVRSHRSAHRA